MTLGFRTMLQLEGDITYRFSIGGVTARHSLGSGGRVRQLFNGSWRQMREVVSLASDGSYLTGTTPAALPLVAAVTGDVYAEIDWPLDAVGIYGVRVQTLPTTGRWRNLKRIPFAAFTDYQLSDLVFPNSRGPVGYCARLLPDGVGAVETVGKIMIVPVPTAGNYRLWYLSAFADRTADTDTFNGLAEFYEWAILQTCIKMLSPDADSQKQYAMWTNERQRVEDLIIARAKRFESDAVEPRDARYDGYEDAGWFNSPL